MIDIDNTFNTVDMFCDAEGCNCNQLFETSSDFPNISEACEEARAYGWEIKKIGGEWEHI